jgi:hypothetical protein
LRTLLVVMTLLLAAVTAYPVGPGFSSGPAAELRELPQPVDPLYCQTPSCGFSANASTPFDSEVADDLPDALSGRFIENVTLYVAEWLDGEWTDPLGLIVSFYDGQCPPSMLPALSCTFQWSDLDVELVEHNPPTRIVYAARAAMPSPVQIMPEMSMGAQVVIDWSFAPYCGFVLTAPDAVSGCGEAYWDDATHGAPRWSTFLESTGLSSDLAYCLTESPTGLPTERDITWGLMKALFQP